MLLSISFLVSISLAVDLPLLAYWGVNGNNDEKRLLHYCQNSDADLFLVGNSQIFPQVKPSFGHHCNSALDASACEQVRNDIKECRKLGKKIILGITGQIPQVGALNEYQYDNKLGKRFRASLSRIPGYELAYGVYLDHAMSKQADALELGKKLDELLPNKKVGFELGCQNDSQYVKLSHGVFDFSIVRTFAADPDCKVDLKFSWDNVLVYSKKEKEGFRAFYGLAGGRSGEGKTVYMDAKTLEMNVAAIIDDKFFGGFAVHDVQLAESNGNYISKVKKVASSFVPISLRGTGNDDRIIFPDN